MTATLQETLCAPGTQPAVLADCQALIEQQVSACSDSRDRGQARLQDGPRFAPGHVTYLIETLLPRMTEELEPFWADFAASGGAEFGDYLAKHGGEVSEALLSVTDARAVRLRAAHHHQGVPHRPRQRGQARSGRAAGRRRHGAEVRGLTA